MLNKLTDSMKFFIFLMVYTAGIAYWAGELTANLNAQTINISAQTQLLDIHIRECAGKNIAHARLEETVTHLRSDVDYLLRVDRERNIFDGIKTKER